MVPLFICVASVLVVISSSFVARLLVGTAFIVTGLIARLTARSSTDPQHPGIIDPVWIGVMGMTCAAILCCQTFAPCLADGVLRDQAPAYYDNYSAELSFLLGKVLDCILALGAVLAGCMAIIWSGEIWRRRTSADAHEAAEYESTTRAAQAMVFAYALVTITTVAWVALPIYRNIALLKHLAR
jgi:hypothetical protein